MRKWLSLALAFMLAFGVASAFAEGGNDAFAGKTLRLVGPGSISSAKPDGITNEDGSYKPGYNDLMNAFMAAYPGVKIEFTPSTWTDWQAFLQTSAAGETADILLHGSMITDICYDLTDYLEKDAWVLDMLAGKPEQYRKDEENYTVTKATGLSYCVNPYYALIDLRILSHYGIETPAYDWTWNDLLAVAKAATGVDPVTGLNTYGCYPFKGTGEIRKGYSSYLASQGIKNMVYKDYKWDVQTTFGSDENAAGMEYYKSLIGCAPANYIEGLGRDKYATAENDIAILLSENMSDDYNKLVTAGLTDDFLFLPLPVNEAEAEAKDSYSSAYCGTSSIAIAYNAKEPDLAWEFIKWLVTDEYAQEWIVANNRCPATYYGIEKMLERNNQSESYTKAYHLTMDNFWDSFATDQMDRVDTSIGDLGSIFTTYFIELIKGNMTAKQAGEAIDADFAETAAMNHK